MRKGTWPWPSLALYPSALPRLICAGQGTRPGWPRPLCLWSDASRLCLTAFPARARSLLRTIEWSRPYFPGNVRPGFASSPTSKTVNYWSVIVISVVWAPLPYRLPFEAFSWTCRIDCPNSSCFSSEWILRLIVIWQTFTWTFYGSLCARGDFKTWTFWSETKKELEIRF